MNFYQKLITDEEKQVLPEAKESDLIELLSKLRRIAPDYQSDSEKARYLLNLISYVDGIINGDDIREYTTYHYTTKFARKALHELSTEIHEQIMEQYKLEKAGLQAELKRLYEEHRMLSDDTARLRGEYETLQIKTAGETSKLSSLEAKLKDEETNGLTRVQTRISEEKEKLSNELQALKDEKKVLASAVKDLQKSFNEWSLKIDGLSERTAGVTWTKITPNHSIYKTNHANIDAYVNALLLEYMEKTSCTKEEATKAFATYCSELSTFAATLKFFRSGELEANSSVSTIINCITWNPASRARAGMLREMLSSMKLPTYERVRTNIDNISLSADNIPSNVNGILRELHLRRVTAEALAKQKIAEAELKTVLGILKSVVPPDYNLDELLNRYNKLEFDNLDEEKGLTRK